LLQKKETWLPFFIPKEEKPALKAVMSSLNSVKVFEEKPVACLNLWDILDGKIDAFLSGISQRLL